MGPAGAGRGAGAARPLAVPVAAADVVQDQCRDLPVSATAFLRGHYGQLRCALDLGVPQFLRQQPDRQRRLDPVVAGDRRAGRLCAVALDLTGKRHDHLVDPGQPHGAANRLHDPLLPGLSPPRASRHADRPDHHLSHLQSLAGDLDDAPLLRPAAALPRGGGLDRRRHALAGFHPHHPAAVRAGARRDGDPLLPVRLERLLLRPDPHPNGSDDGACSGRQFYELRGMGVGPHCRRRHHDHAPCPDLLFRGATLPRPRPDRRCHRAAR